jgi:shikimate kinase
MRLGIVVLAALRALSLPQIVPSRIIPVCVARGFDRSDQHSTIMFAPNWQGARSRVYRGGDVPRFCRTISTTPQPMTRDPAADKAGAAASPEATLAAKLERRSVVLVGMMGAGKSAIGRRLAARIGLPFVDADVEIEMRAGMTIADYFDKYGEAAFRAGEVRVISRLLEHGPQVLATGGGAFMNPDTRAAIRAKAISIWLKADFDVLFRRVKRRNDRPLLKAADPSQVLKRLMVEREPVYAEADETILSRDVAHDIIVDEIVGRLATRFALNHRLATSLQEISAGDRC